MKNVPSTSGTYTYEKRDPVTGAWKGETPVAYDKTNGTKVYQAMLARFDTDSGERRILERHADERGHVRPRTVADSREQLPAAPNFIREADGDILWASA